MGIRMHCRYCGSEKTYKSGIIRGKQRYKCKDCGKNFLETDGRSKQTTVAKRALAVMLYTFSKASAEVKMPEITEDIEEIEFDKM